MNDPENRHIHVCQLDDLATNYSQFSTINIYEDNDTYQRELAKHAQPVIDAFTTGWLYGEVMNGSLHQFYSNSTGIVAPEALIALRRYGMLDAAILLERSIQFFGNVNIRARSEREQLLETYSDEHDDEEDEEAWDPFAPYADELFDKLATEQGGIYVCTGKNMLTNLDQLEDDLQHEIRDRLSREPCSDNCPPECRAFLDSKGCRSL